MDHWLLGAIVRCACFVTALSLRSAANPQALVLMAFTGRTAKDAAAVKLGFGLGATMLGMGTTMMYSNNLAAVSDYVDPSWRASALGSYRFWRDSGYFIGAMVSGVVADSVGIASTVVVVSQRLRAVRCSARRVV